MLSSRFPKKFAVLGATLLGAMLLSAQKLPDLTLVGCLAQGNQPHQYVIQGNGQTYILKSNRLKLSKHVGQEVSVSGGVKGTAENGAQIFHVSAISKMGDTCQQ